MPRHLQRDLERLKKMVLESSALVEEALSTSITALYSRDVRLAERVVANDAEIDRREVMIEDECLKILALHQPVARDLRFVVAVLKLNNDLERIADLAVNVAQRAMALAVEPPVEVPPQLREIAEKATRMVKGCLDALIESDVAAAAKVCAADDEVDALHRQLFSILQDAIKESPQRLEQLIQLLSVTRYLERVADQATNIAEDVIYMVEGEVVRHRKPQ